MIQKERRASVNGMAIAMLLFLNAVFLKAAYEENEKYYAAMLISVPLLVMAIWQRVKR